MSGAPPPPPGTPSSGRADRIATMATPTGTTPAASHAHVVDAVTGRARSAARFSLAAWTDKPFTTTAVGVSALSWLATFMCTFLPWVV